MPGALYKISRLSLITFILCTGCFLSSAKEVVLSFEYYNRLIFLNVKVNNTDSLLFLMDTGANASAIDETTANNLSLEDAGSSVVEGTAGTTEVRNVKIAKLAVGPMLIKDLVVTKYDLSTSPAPHGKKLNGILGTDFLKLFSLTINFQKQTIRLSDSRTRVTSDHIPFTMDNGIPSVQTTLNDTVSLYLRYDSGASLFETDDIYLNLPETVFRSLNTGTKEPAFYLSASGIGGEIKLPVYKTTSAAIGHVAIQEPYLIVQPAQGYFARKDALGFFSNNLLEKYPEITIDFISGYIFISPKN